MTCALSDLTLSAVSRSATSATAGSAVRRAAPAASEPAASTSRRETGSDTGGTPDGLAFATGPLYSGTRTHARRRTRSAGADWHPSCGPYPADRAQTVSAWGFFFRRFSMMLRTLFTTLAALSIALWAGGIATADDTKAGTHAGTVVKAA